MAAKEPVPDVIVTPWVLLTAGDLVDVHLELDR